MRIPSRSSCSAQGRNWLRRRSAWTGHPDWWPAESRLNVVPWKRTGHWAIDPRKGWVLAWYFTFVREETYARGSDGQPRGVPGRRVGAGGSPGYRGAPEDLRDVPRRSRRDAADLAVCSTSLKPESRPAPPLGFYARVMQQVGEPQAGTHIFQPLRAGPGVRTASGIRLPADAGGVGQLSGDARDRRTRAAVSRK